MKRRFFVPLLSLLTCLVAAAPAPAAITGTYTGETSQDLSALDEPYKTDIVITVLNGRIVGIVAELRLECGPAEITDARVLKSYSSSKGPKIAGGFAFKVQGVRIEGTIGKKAGNGGIAATKGGCSGHGTWAVKKRKV
jgi:major membrane immunogen (membrane-anchored lipoprotein)